MIAETIARICEMDPVWGDSCEWLCNEDVGIYKFCGHRSGTRGKWKYYWELFLVTASNKCKAYGFCSAQCNDRGC